MKNLMLLLLALVIIGGCAMTGMSDVTLTAARTGNQVMLTLRNGSAAPVGYNLCTSGLQRMSGASWEPVETGDICTMEIRTLQPGDTATFEKTLPSGLGAGEYRYVTNIEADGSRRVVASNPFRVE